jgi:hypothetical protein
VSLLASCRVTIASDSFGRKKARAPDHVQSRGPREATGPGGRRYADASPRVLPSLGVLENPPLMRPDPSTVGVQERGLRFEVMVSPPLP